MEIESICSQFVLYAFMWYSLKNHAKKMHIVYSSARPLGTRHHTITIKYSEQRLKNAQREWKRFWNSNRKTGSTSLPAKWICLFVQRFRICIMPFPNRIPEIVLMKITVANGKPLKSDIFRKKNNNKTKKCVMTSISNWKWLYIHIETKHSHLKHVSQNTCCYDWWLMTIPFEYVHVYIQPLHRLEAFYVHFSTQQTNNKLRRCASGSFEWFNTFDFFIVCSFSLLVRSSFPHRASICNSPVDQSIETYRW